VKQQVKPQPKPQVEQEKKPQALDKIYHEDGGDMGMKQKTRRGSRKSRSSKDLTHIKCLSARMRDTLPRCVSPSLRRWLKQKRRGKAMRSNT
jgi:hypothetical protein